jgi:hypothetical protein
MYTFVAIKFHTDLNQQQLEDLITELLIGQNNQDGALLEQLRSHVAGLDTTVA